MKRNARTAPVRTTLFVVVLSTLAACHTSREAVTPAEVDSVEMDDATAAASPLQAREESDVRTRHDAAPQAVQRAKALIAPAPAAPPAPAAMSPALEAYAVSGNVAVTGNVMAMPPPANTEKYAAHADNPVQRAAEQPVSTFSIDVDTGSYANVRRMLQQGVRPPADAVRAEEFINYFHYGHPAPASRETPFRVTTELAAAPWNAQRQVLMIGIKGYDVP